MRSTGSPCRNDMGDMDSGAARIWSSSDFRSLFSVSLWSGCLVREQLWVGDDELAYHSVMLRKGNDVRTMPLVHVTEQEVRTHPAAVLHAFAVIIRRFRYVGPCKKASRKHSRLKVTHRHLCGRLRVTALETLC